MTKQVLRIGTSSQLVKYLKWDVENRLIEIKTNEMDNELTAVVVRSYEYDDDGERTREINHDNNNESSIIVSGLLQKTEAGLESRIIFDGVNRVAVVQASEVTDGEGDSIEQRKTFYNHSDNIGSTLAITDEKGNKIQDIRYKSFGEIVSLINSIELGGLISIGFGFTGQQYDDDVDLSYYGARWYDQRYREIYECGYGSGWGV